MHHVVVPSLVVRYSKKFGLGCGQGTSISMSAVWINTNFSNAHAVVQNLEQQAIASAGKFLFLDIAILAFNWLWIVATQ